MLEISLDTLTNFGHQGGKEFSEGIFKKTMSNSYVRNFYSQRCDNERIF